VRDTANRRIFRTACLTELSSLGFSPGDTLTGELADDIRDGEVAALVTANGRVYIARVGLPPGDSITLTNDCGTATYKLAEGDELFRIVAVTRGVGPDEEDEEWPEYINA